MDDQLVVIMPPDHPLCRREVVRFVDLLDHPFIGMAAGSALLTLFRGQATALGRTLNEQARVSTFDGVTEMVVAGVGIGILPGAIAARAAAPRGLMLRQLDESWATRPLIICTRELAQLPAAARLFLDHVRKA